MTKLRRLTINLSAADLAGVQLLAKRDEVSTSEYLRRLIRELAAGSIEFRARTVHERNGHTAQQTKELSQ